eukprot:Polyplicarium_translucidae@DN2179_c0_g1_i4.p1
MVQDVVVRVFSKSGRTRVTISNGATLMELKRIVASHLNTDGDLQLSDGKNRIFTGDRKTLASLGITSGDVLHAESSSERSPEIAPVQLEHRGTRTVEPTNVPSRSSRDVPSAAEPTTGVSSEATTSLKFLSFDSFLQKLQFNTSQLPMSLSYKPTRLERGKMIKLPPAATLKHQPYRHVDHVEFMSEFDSDWLVVRVNESAPKKAKSRFSFATFHRTNRSAPLKAQMICDHLSRYAGTKSPAQFADFHFLIGVGVFFGVETALAICDAIVTGTPVDPDLHEVLKSL